MTDSMTAFARGQIQLETASFCWEIKSVNHRYLDVSFRLPENWRFLEAEFRAALRGKISRGKLECQLKQQDNLPAQQKLAVNETLVDALLSASARLASDKQLPDDLRVSTVLSWPGVVYIPEADVEQSGEAILALFQTSLQQLQDVRAAEGKVLAEEVSSRLELLEREITTAKTLAAACVSQARDKLQMRLDALKTDVDTTRTEQELALMLIKMDVNEELDRLTLHSREVAKVLAGSEATGRRLDFLMQELHREANTLSAKSDTVALTRSAVEMKVLIEQMREQIQNIE